MIPPTLTKVWEEVLEGELDELEEDAVEEGEAPVPAEDGPQPPADKVEDDKLVEEGVPDVCEGAGLLGGVDAAVCGVLALGEGDVEARVDVDKPRPHVADVLEEQEDDKHQPAQAGALRGLPEHGVGAAEEGRGEEEGAPDNNGKEDGKDGAWGQAGGADTRFEGGGAGERAARRRASTAKSRNIAKTECGPRTHSHARLRGAGASSMAARSAASPSSSSSADVR